MLPLSHLPCFTVSLGTKKQKQTKKISDLFSREPVTATLCHCPSESLVQETGKYPAGVGDKQETRYQCPQIWMCQCPAVGDAGTLASASIRGAKEGGAAPFTMQAPCSAHGNTTWCPNPDPLSFLTSPESQARPSARLVHGLCGPSCLCRLSINPVFSHTCPTHVFKGACSSAGISLFLGFGLICFYYRSVT